MSAEEKYARLAELEKRHSEASAIACGLAAQIRQLEDEIAADKSRFRVGDVIALNKTKRIKIGYHKSRLEPYQEKYRIIHIGDRHTTALRIKKDGSDGVVRQLYSWDIDKAKLVEPPNEPTHPN